MKDLTPLTAKNGESEWPYEGKTLIAVPEINVCKQCYIWDNREDGIYLDCELFPVCNEDFEVPIIYIEKPAES